MNSFKMILRVIFVLLLFSCNKKANDTTEKNNLEVVKQDKFPKKPLAEDRSIDENEPPIVFDIIEARKTVKNLKCSQFENTIRYVKLSHPFDNEFLQNTKITLTPYDIVVNVEKGIALFDAEGKFIEMICKDGKKYEKSEGGYYYTTSEIRKKYIGSVGSPMIYGDKIYYKYVNVPQGIGKLMEYVPTYGNTSPTVAKIDTALSKPKGSAIANVKAEYNWNSIMTVAVDENSFANIPGKFDSYQSGYFMNLLSWGGDTICKFKDYDRDLDKAFGRIYRNAESTIYSQSKDELLIRQCYNDTIFKLMLPNRLQPKYIINFEGKGVNSAKEGMSPGVDLSGRFVVEDIKNIKDFLLILYTQDYPCPNTVQQGTLKYNLYILIKNGSKVIMLILMPNLMCRQFLKIVLFQALGLKLLFKELKTI